METKHVIAALSALAQETRLAIFRLLVETGPRGLSVGEIGSSVRTAPATLSFHLKELAHAGLIGARQDGRYIYYAVNYQRMNEVLGFLTENCCARDRTTCPPTASRTPTKVKPARGRRSAKRRDSSPK